MQTFFFISLTEKNVLKQFFHLISLIVIINVCQQHKLSCHLSLWIISILASLQDNIQCLHGIDECKFLLVGQYQSVHVQEFIECHLEVCPNVSSSSSYLYGLWDGRYTCFTGYCFQDLFKRASLYSFHVSFSPGISLV